MRMALTVVLAFGLIAGLGAAIRGPHRRPFAHGSYGHGPCGPNQPAVAAPLVPPSVPAPAPVR